MFFLNFCFYRLDSWRRNPIIWHAKLFGDVEFHFVYGQLLRRNSRQFLFSEVVLALVNFTRSFAYLCRMRHFNERSSCNVVGLRGLLEVDFRWKL